MALWSSSAAMVSVIDAMNRAFDIEDSRPWWKRRLIAIALTIGLALFILTSFGLIVAGPWLADFLGRQFGLAPAFTMAWKVLQWPVVFLLASTGFGVVYYFAPDAEQEWVWITPGALTATALWFIASLAFRYYVVNFGNYEEAYGTLGAIILTLLWFYITGLAMVIGAELSAEIHRVSPWGRNPGPTSSDSGNVSALRRRGNGSSITRGHRGRLLLRRSAFDVAGELQHPGADTDAASFDRTKVHVETYAAAFDDQGHRSTHTLELA